MGRHEEPYIDPGPGGPPDTVVIDIGGNVGGLIVHTTEACLGSEVDLTPVGEPRSHHVHTMIRRRRLVNRDVFVGVYPDLLEGRYVVWGLNGQLGEVTVTGGSVAEFDAGNLRDATTAIS